LGLGASFWGLGLNKPVSNNGWGLGLRFGAWGFIKQLPQSVGIEFSFGAWGLPVTGQFPKAVGALGFVLGLTKQLVQSVGIEVSFWGLGLRFGAWGLGLGTTSSTKCWGLKFLFGA